MATSRCEAQKAIRVRGNRLCPNHYGKQVVYFCENCKELVCTDCVTQQHKAHTLERISKVVMVSKQKLKDFVTRIEQIEIPKINDNFLKVEKDLSSNENYFIEIINEVKNQNEVAKKELDSKAELLVNKCHYMKRQSSDEFFTYKTELQSRLSELTSNLLKAKASLQSDNDALVYDTSNIIPSVFEDVPPPSYSTAKFIPGKISLPKLEHLLGEVHVIKQTPLRRSLYQSGDWNAAPGFIAHKGYLVKSIRAVACEQAWISLFNVVRSRRNSKKLLLVTQTGQVQKTVKAGVPIVYFNISPKHGEIYCCMTDNSVRKMRGNKLEAMFTTSSRSLSVCVTEDDHLVIGCDNQIVKFMMTGQVVCTTPAEKQSIVRCPSHISECSVTNHLAVVDRDYADYGGHDEPFVAVFNSQLQLLFTCTGEGQPSSLSPLHPFDVCFTSVGELVITCRNNKTVTLVSSVGTNLQTLCTHNTSGPLAVCIYNGALWVSFDNETVFVLILNKV